MADKSGRQNRIGEELSELRCSVPLYTLQILDAVASSETRSSGKMVSRTELITKMLINFSNHELDRSSLVLQVTGFNPTVLEAKA